MNEDILDSPIEGIYELQQLTAKDRYYNMILEYFVSTIVIMFPLSILTNGPLELLEVPSNHPIRSYIEFTSVVGFIVLLFNKDCIMGQSIVKRWRGQQVIDIKTKEPASPMRCFVRNWTFLVWFLDLIFTTADPHRRLGDRIAGTMVVKVPTLKEQNIGLIASLKTDWSQIKKNSLWFHLLKSFLITSLVGILFYLIAAT